MISTFSSSKLCSVKHPIQHPTKGTIVVSSTSTMETFCSMEEKRIHNPTITMSRTEPLEILTCSMFISGHGKNKKHTWTLGREEPRQVSGERSLC